MLHGVTGFAPSMDSLSFVALFASFSVYFFSLVLGSSLLTLSDAESSEGLMVGRENGAS